MRGLSDAWWFAFARQSARVGWSHGRFSSIPQGGTSIALREPREFDLAHGQNDKVGL
jgi:hypothetical protein